MERILSQEQINALLEKGCKIWEGGKARRIYINLDKLGVLNLSFYSTGNISHAELLAEEISNSQAYKLLAVKIYVDLTDNKLHINNCTDRVKEDIEKALNYLLA